jgi:hypothetical protein
MSKKTKAFIYNLLCFAVLFILFRFLIENYTGLTGYFIPLTAFVIGTLLAPKFQATKINGEEMIFMRWIFIKGVKKIG